jgi:hypothetical protein
VTEARIVGGKTTFLVAVDYSVGFGSYAGVTTELLDILHGQFTWAEPTNIGAKEPERIQLPKTLKADWRLVPFRGNHDILLTYCRPPEVQVGNEFEVGYVR